MIVQHDSTPTPDPNPLPPHPIDGPPSSTAPDQPAGTGSATDTEATDTEATDTEATDKDQARLERIEQTLRDLLETHRSDQRRAEARERVIDHLHDENQRLKAGERQLVVRPLLIDLQRLRNELLRLALSLPDPLPADRATALFASFAASVEVVLERFGVLPVVPEPHDRFDPARHRVAEVVPTDRSDLDGVITAVVEPGYVDTTTGRLIGLAAVRVSRYSAPDATAEPAPGTP